MLNCQSLNQGPHHSCWSLRPCPNFCPLWFSLVAHNKKIHLREKPTIGAPGLMAGLSWCHKLPAPFPLEFALGQTRGNISLWVLINNIKHKDVFKDKCSENQVTFNFCHVQYDKVKSFNCAFDDLELHISASITTIKKPQAAGWPFYDVCSVVKKQHTTQSGDQKPTQVVVLCSQWFQVKQCLF